MEASPIVRIEVQIDFEWDDWKAKTNLKKHSVSFEEAQSVFSNPLAVIFNDEFNSTTERREIIIGHSAQNRVLLVAFTERRQRIRIISARTATRKEREDYERNVF